MTMRGTIFLWFLSIWSTDALISFPVFKKCPGECVSFEFCQIAKVLLKKNDPAALEAIRNQTCGINLTTNIPLVCCSELRDDDSEVSSDEARSVESHPNLRLLPESCGHIDGDKIVGGIEAGLFEYPWMALISYYTLDGLSFNCDGFLINERYVLTAAHCVVNQRIAGVRLGEHDYESYNYCQGEDPKMVCELPLQDFRVEQEIPHTNYLYPQKRNDIALLRLKKPVSFDNKNVRTLCLPVTKALLNREIVGLNGTVAGWGFTEHRAYSSKLLAVAVPIISREDCRSSVQFQNRFISHQAHNQNIICAGMLGKDSCQGDSGGPLMLKSEFKGSGQRYVAYGIVSYGPVNCGSGVPAVHTDVTKYMKWILDNIRP